MILIEFFLHQNLFKNYRHHIFYQKHAMLLCLDLSVVLSSSLLTMDNSTGLLFRIWKGFAWFAVANNTKRACACMCVAS